ncbi:hypothetical protein FLP10_07970 [Agromyces intestinalis]|uniref:Uncharacterized protein n=1 Tax=Agromyces intestinalis TaxID=2592652 RepID=A0A5C1YHW4_9MICO|nr:acyltransferase domain-containing protein [Agromyces intestinalis]QEO14362.1 hypothetical protein FLP10_07970 [Agromyces intestinalis]
MSEAAGPRPGQVALGVAGRLPATRPELMVVLGHLIRTDQPAGGDGDVLTSLRAETGDALVSALAACVPLAMDRQRRAGIPEQITRATLRDVGRKHARYGAATVLDWLIELMRGDVVELGRLQVARRAEALGHAVHIPETGPLDPGAVDASLERIREFTGARRLSCTSWLLDAEIRRELPHSNLAAFARRFEVVAGEEGSRQGSEAVAKFVFRRPLEAVLDGRVHPESRLERLIIDRLRSGRHWSEPTGVLDG